MPVYSKELITQDPQAYVPLYDKSEEYERTTGIRHFTGDNNTDSIVAAPEDDESKLLGIGTFALRDIKYREKIGDYTGLKIPYIQGEPDVLAISDYFHGSGVPGDEYMLCATATSEISNINSGFPNVWNFKDGMRAIENIEAGDPLYINYGPVHRSYSFDYYKEPRLDAMLAFCETVKSADFNTQLKYLAAAKLSVDDLAVVVKLSHLINIPVNVYACLFIAKMSTERVREILALMQQYDPQYRSTDQRNCWACVIGDFLAYIDLLNSMPITTAKPMLDALEQAYQQGDNDFFFTATLFSLLKTTQPITPAKVHNDLVRAEVARYDHFIQLTKPPAKALRWTDKRKQQFSKHNQLIIKQIRVMNPSLNEAQAVEYLIDNWELNHGLQANSTFIKKFESLRAHRAEHIPAQLSPKIDTKISECLMHIVNDAEKLVRCYMLTYEYHLAVFHAKRYASLLSRYCDRPFVDNDRLKRAHDQLTQLSDECDRKAPHRYQARLKYQKQAANTLFTHQQYEKALESYLKLLNEYDGKLPSHNTEWLSLLSNICACLVKLSLWALAIKFLDVSLAYFSAEEPNIQVEDRAKFTSLLQKLHFRKLTVLSSTDAAVDTLQQQCQFTTDFFKQRDVELNAELAELLQRYVAPQ